MTGEVIDWKDEWNSKPDTEKYLRITEVLNMTIIIKGVEFKQGKTKDNRDYEYVVLDTDKGKVKSSGKLIVSSAKEKIEPVIKSGGIMRATVKSKLTANGTYYYLVSPS